MSDIFISYASEDIAETNKLAHALETQGWSVWWDRSIPIGKGYEKTIEAALNEAKCVIVIWSKISVKSEWVRAEAAEARNQGKLFPLNIDGSKPPLVYRALQTADFSYWSNDETSIAFQQLVSNIRSYIEESDSVEKDDTNDFSGKARIKSGTVSSSEQAFLTMNKHKSKKWLASISAILLLPLLIGGVLLEPKKPIFALKRIIDNMFFSSEPVIEPEMVTIPKGCFQMGSPESDLDRVSDETLHKVCVDSFKIGIYEVSNKEYDQLCKSEDCRHDSDLANLPANYVSWEDATAYAEWLAGKTGKDYRLPTEAEWEYAARGNKRPQTRYPWGDEIGNNKANCNGCGSQQYHNATPIGSFAANDFGLYDTVGNVREWTCSLYKKTYDGFESNCADIQASKRRINRGGDYHSPTESVRSAGRLWNQPGQRNGTLGFRLAQD